jgi:pimeloyl-ACP methyl ester carboxylesterase
MSAIVIDGGIVHYEAFGRGPPVIFIHGWLGSWRYWMPTMEEVARMGRRAYAFDLWGFGDSDKSHHSYELPEFTKMTALFMQEMGIQQAPIVGHALGATIGVKLAMTDPGKVEKLMAVSLPLYPDAISRRLLTTASNFALAKIFWWRQPVYEEVQQEAQKAAENAVAISIKSTTALDVQQSLAELAIPTLIVYGEKDNVVDPSYNKGLNGKWPNVRPIGLKESSHFPMLDEKSKFNRLLKDFLEAGMSLAELELKEEWRRRTR